MTPDRPRCSVASRPDGRALAFVPTGADGADADSIHLSGCHGYVMLMWTAFDGDNALSRAGR